MVDNSAAGLTENSCDSNTQLLVDSTIYPADKLYGEIQNHPQIQLAVAEDLELYLQYVSKECVRISSGRYRPQISEVKLMTASKWNDFGCFDGQGGR
ncbi:hypothetical protein J6590_063637 [Homalodisca vitripennis]|nr:hypothetical protein J6590_063637 [Homalodisca vitripennis]